MVYKKNVNVVSSEDNVILSLSVNEEVKTISAIVCDGEKEVASVVSVIHNLDELKGEKCYEILLVESVNSINTSLRVSIMFRLQKFFYECLHDLGIRYFWFETKNLKIVEIIERLYSLYSTNHPNRYYVDLNRMFYHKNEQPNQ